MRHNGRWFQGVMNLLCIIVLEKLKNSTHNTLYTHLHTHMYTHALIHVQLYILQDGLMYVAIVSFEPEQNKRPLLVKL